MDTMERASSCCSTVWHKFFLTAFPRGVGGPPRSHRARSFGLQGGRARRPDEPFEFGSAGDESPVAFGALVTHEHLHGVEESRHVERGLVFSRRSEAVRSTMAWRIASMLRDASIMTGSRVDSRDTIGAGRSSFSRGDPGRDGVSIGCRENREFSTGMLDQRDFFLTDIYNTHTNKNAKV